MYFQLRSFLHQGVSRYIFASATQCSVAISIYRDVSTGSTWNIRVVCLCERSATERGNLKN